MPNTAHINNNRVHITLFTPTGREICSVWSSITNARAVIPAKSLAAGIYSIDIELSNGHKQAALVPVYR